MTEPHASEDPLAAPEPRSPPAAAEKQRLAMALTAHFALVWRSLRRFGIPEADVDDAAQHAFLTLSGRLSDVKPGSERAFLLGTCQGIAANHRKKMRRRPEVTDEEPDQRPGPAPNPEEAMVEKQRRAKLDEALAELPLDQRTVFVLYELEGFSVREIAESLAIPAGTAASRLRRARERFEAFATALGPTGDAP
ncbi:MAG TPA: sigma-70 family RNA polymerase sigma factor [Polyangiaceae bacterium]|jgi:RNA polymerase sigma-70 factor (ECF subfamily)|nr:sigma-70 family RNA polymerase sigma factor [Polyangiaceae bacterium]